jgi:hypothetical protein
MDVMTVEDLERAVAELSADQFEQFLAWIEEFNAARFDRKIERDVAGGKLNRLADEALTDFRAGRAREL